MKKSIEKIKSDLENNTLPPDVEDYICKSSAWLNEMIPNNRIDLREYLIRLGDKLLEKYD